MTAVARSTATPTTRRRDATDIALVVLVGVGALLRVWDLGRARLGIDESYTALAARLPVPDLVRHIDQSDPHPPLFYLLLRPVAALTTDLGALRLLSAVASCAAVGVMAVWMRRRGLAGLVATGVFALSPYQLFYGRQVRMYGLLALGGVVGAWALARWLATSGRGWAVLGVVAGAVVAFSHGVGILFLASMLLVPGLRRDRDAWVLRGALAVAGGLFALLWGAHALSWRETSGGAVSGDSLGWLSIVLNEAVAPVPDNRWIVLPLLIGGAVVILRGRGDRRVWLCLFAVPVAALYVVSLRQGVLVPKSLMPFSWGVPLALGAAVGWLADRRAAFGWVATAGLVLIVLPYVPHSLGEDEGSGAAIDRAFAMVGPDEGIAVRSDEWQGEALALWNGPVAGGLDLDPNGQDHGGVVLYQRAGSDSSRALFVTMRQGELPAPLEPCGPAEALGGSLTAQCVEVGAARSTSDDP